MPAQTGLNDWPSEQDKSLTWPSYPFMRNAVFNLLDSLPSELDQESSLEILKSDNLLIERIVSKGHTSPEQGWYDQAENEWVMVLQGAGELTYEDGRTLRLTIGDSLLIPAHVKHKVSWTDPDTETVWLAVFFQLI